MQTTSAAARTSEREPREMLMFFKLLFRVMFLLLCPPLSTSPSPHRERSFGFPGKRERLRLVGERIQEGGVNCRTLASMEGGKFVSSSRPSFSRAETMTLGTPVSCGGWIREGASGLVSSQPATMTGIRSSSRALPSPPPLLPVPLPPVPGGSPDGPLSRAGGHTSNPCPSNPTLTSSRRRTRLHRQAVRAGLRPCGGAPTRRLAQRQREGATAGTHVEIPLPLHCPMQPTNRWGWAASDGITVMPPGGTGCGGRGRDVPSGVLVARGDWGIVADVPLLSFPGALSR